MIRRLRGLSAGDWDVLDRVLAGVIFIAMVVDLTVGHRHESLVLEILLAAVIAAALPWRRKQPLLVAVVVLAAAGTLLTVFTGPNRAPTVAFLVVLTAYSTGAHLELRWSLAALVVTVAAVVAVSLTRTPSDLAFPLLFFAIVPWGVGRVIRTQTALARELTEKAEHEQVARDEEEARAARAERARVARELHDVLAHNLSVMVIQAAAARRVADRDPAAAVEAARLISRTGREALSELRYVFGPMRRADGALGSSPGLANVDQLVSRAHRAGVLVELRVEGTPVQLSPGADLAAYRVIQEALTNSIKHARGARARVVVRYESRDVVVEVVDDGASTSANGSFEDNGGHGLVGMRERVALYGGKVEAGRRSEGGFAVRARLPVAGALP